MACAEEDDEVARPPSPRPDRPIHSWQIWCTGYLKEYGYCPSGASVWRVKPKDSGPMLSLAVTGHEEIGGHTRYNVECSLHGSGAGHISWKALRRLCQLRGQLHDVVKRELGGGGYQKNFMDATFAFRGGMPGTTARLSAWCGTLATGINEGSLSPRIAAIVLQALDAPKKMQASSTRPLPLAPTAWACDQRSRRTVPEGTTPRRGEGLAPKPKSRRGYYEKEAEETPSKTPLTPLSQEKDHSPCFPSRSNDTDDSEKGHVLYQMAKDLRSTGPTLDGAALPDDVEVFKIGADDSDTSSSDASAG